jgi:TPR repeat protein
MAHDIFVSHSARDKIAADAVVAHLERGGLRCWCAPRDIRPGADWPTSIVDSINGCKAMVVVFSSNANESGHIPREVERAVNRGVPVIPVRIEDVVPKGGLEYFFSSSHWMDAITPPLEQHLDKLAEQLGAVLQAKKTERLVTPRPAVAARRSIPLLPILLVVTIIAAGAIGVLIFYLAHKPSTALSSTTATPAVTIARSVAPSASSVAPITSVPAPSVGSSLGESSLLAEYQEWKRLSMVTWNNSYLIDNARQRYAAWRQAADSGDPIGEFFVGYAFQHGLTVPEDPAQGVTWLTKAAEQKNSDAMLDLALCYSLGIGTTQDLMQYGRWIRGALDSNNTGAMVAHGMGLIMASPIPSDKEEGKRLVYQAADAGNIDGVYASALINVGSPSEFNSRMEKAAAGGQPDALYIRAESFKGTEQGRKMVIQALATMGDPLAIARIIDPAQKFGFNHPNLFPDLAWKRLQEMANEGSAEATRLLKTLQQNGKAP